MESCVPGLTSWNLVFSFFPDTVAAACRIKKKPPYYSKVSKGLGIWATQTTFMLKDWLKDTFTAHSLQLPKPVLVSYLD